MFHLRADLARELDDEGRLVALDDRVYGRRIDLGPATAALAAALDGRPRDALLDELGRAHGRARVESMLRRFLLLGLVEEASPGTTARLAAIRSGEARLLPSVLAGSRFGCQGSGACCRGHRLGPLADEDVARLESLGHGEAVITLERDDGGSARYLRQVEGRCLFLEDDDRCGLHRRHGADSKPGFCRLYPLELAATIEGLKLYDKGACATLARSARSGLPLAEQLGEARAIAGTPPLYHPVVRFSDRLLYDHAHHLAFTRAGLGLVGRGAGAGETLRALGRLALALGEALAAFPLEPGEPERARDAVLGADPAPLFAPASLGVQQEGAEMLSVVLADLEEVAAAPGVRAALGERQAGAMEALLAATRARALRLADPDAAPAPRAPVDDETLRLSIAQQLFSTRSLVADRPLAGLLRMAVVCACAATHADLSLGHSLAVRLLEVKSAAAVLVQHEELASSSLEGMALVL
jgi:Fe-S-cluster containining protein